MSETGYEARFHGIGYPHHDNRDNPSGFLGCLGGRCIDGHDHVDFEPQKVLNESRKPLVVSRRIPQFYVDAASLDIAKLAKLVAKRLEQAGLQVLRQNANPPG
jgi:hypothetical protein